MYRKIVLFILAFLFSFPVFAAHDEQFKINFTKGSQESLQECLSKSCSKCQDYACYVAYNDSMQEVLDEDDEFELYNLDNFDLSECNLPPWKRNNDNNGRCKVENYKSVDTTGMPPWRK